MILIVDDNEDLRGLLEIALKEVGFRVETAVDGVDAYNHLSSEDCRCMLLDINMPRINGIELLMLMQSEGLKVPTILMAGHGDYAEDEVLAIENVKAFLPKPFSIQDLVDAIQKHARIF